MLRISLRPAWVVLFALAASLPALARGQERPEGPTSPVTALVLSGDRAVAGSQDGLSLVALAEPLGSTPFRPLENVSHIHHLLQVPGEEQLVAVGGSPHRQGVLCWLRASDLSELRRIELGEDVLYDACWIPASSLEETGSENAHLAVAGPAEYVSLVDPRTGRTRRLNGHSRTVLCVEHLPGERPLLISAGRDATLRVWDTSQWELLRTFNNHTDDVLDLAARPQPESDSAGLPMLASAGADKTVRFWQPTIGRLVRFARLESVPLQIAWSPDGQTLWAACRDGRLRAIDVDTVEVRTIPTALDHWAYAFTVDWQRNLAVVGGANGTLDRVSLDPR